MKAFGNVHPFVLLVYFLSVLTVAMFAANPVLSLTALLGGILFCAMLVRRSLVPGDIGFYVPLFLLVAVTNPLFSHNGVTPLFFLNGNPVTLEALLYGSMALRFVPQFRRQMRRVRCAQKTMGLYAARGYTDKVRSAGRVFLAMIAWSLENAMETAASMKARGYGRGRRTNFSLFRFTARDGALLAVCAALMGVVAVGMAAGVTAFDFYPRVSTPELTPAALAVYIAFGALSLLPFTLEVREAIVWRYYRSRI